MRCPTSKHIEILQIREVLDIARIIVQFQCRSFCGHPQHRQFFCRLDALFKPAAHLSAWKITSLFSNDMKYPGKWIKSAKSSTVLRQDLPLLSPKWSRRRIFLPGSAQYRNISSSPHVPRDGSLLLRHIGCSRVSKDNFHIAHII